MFSAVKYTIKEHVDNREMLFKLARIHMGKTTVRATGGAMWVYIHDILYFTAFTFFRILLTGNGSTDGMNGLEYLMTALVPWLLISEVMNSATNAIRLNKVIVQSIKFPITILPSVEVIAILMKRLPTFLFIFIVCGYYGHLRCFNIGLFLYYIVGMILLLLGITLLFSGINAISEDFHQLYMTAMRVLFFALPIMWSFDTLKETSYEILGEILKLNPLVYIIQGFRDAFVLGNTQSTEYGIYFWIVTIVVLLLGCYVQKKLQKFYSDFI